MSSQIWCKVFALDKTNNYAPKLADVPNAQTITPTDDGGAIIREVIESRVSALSFPGELTEQQNYINKLEAEQNPPPPKDNSAKIAEAQAALNAARQA